MLHAALRWIVPLAAFFVVGPLSAWMVAALTAVDGSGHATFFTSAALAKALIALAIALIAAAGTGVLASRLLGPRTGLFAAGLVLAWSAYSTGPMNSVVSLAGRSALSSFTIESALLALVGLGLAVAVLAIRPINWPTPAPTAAHPHPQPLTPPPEPRQLFASNLPVALAACLGVSGVMVYLIAQDTLPLQTLAACIIAGVFGALAARVVALNISAAVFVLAVTLLGVLGGIAALLLHSGPTAAADAALANRLFFLARPSPMTYLAGALLGVPMGLSWADSIVHKHVPAHA